MTYALIDPRMWDDAAFVGLDDATRVLWVALLTGPQVTALPGLQKASVGVLADTLRRPPEAIRAALATLTGAGMAYLDEGCRVVRVPNAPKYNAAKSPNHIKAWWKRWQEIPDCALKFAHVATLREAAGLENPSHEAAWDRTFGKLPDSKTLRSPTGVPTEVPSEALREYLPNSVSESVSVSESGAVSVTVSSDDASASPDEPPFFALVADPEEGDGDEDGDDEAGDPQGRKGKAKKADDPLPLPGTLARRAYDALLASEHLAQIVERPSNYATMVTEPGLYPAIDVPMEIRKAALWLASDSTRKKKKGRAFLTRWLNGAQEKSPGRSGGIGGTHASRRFVLPEPPAKIVAPPQAALNARRFT